LLTGAGQGRHDGANRVGGNGGDFLIRATFEFAEYEDFAKVNGECFKGLGNALAVVAGDGQRFGGRRIGRQGVLVQFGSVLVRTILAEPGVAIIADNLKKPGAGIASTEARKETIGAQHGFLGSIFSVGTIAKEPASQIEGGVEVRQDALLESLSFLRFQHVPQSLSLRW